MSSIYNDPQACFDEEHVRGVLALHHAECVFELDAPKKIVERLSGKTVTEWLKMKHREEFKACWTASEIFCPHEGIDRLAECGVRTLNWELA
jgi:hypothetical protein